MKTILACCFLLLSSSALAVGVPAKPHITVSGLGTVQVVPDMVTVHVAVEQFGKQIDHAKRVVDKKTTAAVAVAGDQGIEKRDIVATRIRVRPRYETHDHKRSLAGYVVTRQLTLTLRDLGRYQALLQGLVAAGVNHINGVTRRYSQPATLRSKAFALAIKDARVKAKRLATGFGATLGSVYAITEQSSPAPRPQMRAFASAKSALADTVASEPGTIDVKARLQVVFRLKVDWD